MVEAVQVPPSGELQGTHVRSDPRSHAIDLLFFRRLWHLCRPYWTREGAWVSYVTLAAIVSIGALGSLAGAGLAFVTARQQDALVAKNVPGYWSAWAVYTGWGLLIFGGSVGATFMSGALNLSWRRWLTSYLIDNYLEHRTYYEITIDEDIDNPDQRIQEQVGPFIMIISGIPQQLLNTSLNIVVQVMVLMSISMPMLVATGLYIIANAIIVLYVNRPTIRQNWDSVVAEADFRYGLLHVRDHAETIAFYRGEKAERRHLADRLGVVIATQARILRYKVLMSFVEQGTNISWGILPMVLISPLYFEGKVSFGMIGTAVIAASLISSSIGQLIQYIPQLSGLVPHAVRLAEIQEKFEILGRARQTTSGAPRIARRLGNEVRLDGLTLMTPRGEQTLVKALSLAVRPGEHMLILGQTGVGKSSLLRAMAGLWTRGTGELVTPPPESIMFLPQRPYMMLGTLRSQLTYPWRPNARRPSDTELADLLETVCLPDLVKIHGGLDAEQDWGRILSLGEQQRIAFARVLLAMPDYVFLDEATSAVDIATEQQLYGMLLANPITLISVGHRPSLIDYHTKILDLRVDGWSVGSVANHVPPSSHRIKRSVHGPHTAAT